MSDKPNTSTASGLRVYENIAQVLTIEDAENPDDWAKVQLHKDRVYVDRGGEPWLDAKHARMLGERLIEWAAKLERK